MSLSVDLESGVRIVESGPEIHLSAWAGTPVALGWWLLAAQVRACRQSSVVPRFVSPRRTLLPAQQLGPLQLLLFPRTLVAPRNPRFSRLYRPSSVTPTLLTPVRLTRGQAERLVGTGGTAPMTTLAQGQSVRTVRIRVAQPVTKLVILTLPLPALRATIMWWGPTTVMVRVTGQVPSLPPKAMTFLPRVIRALTFLPV